MGVEMTIVLKRFNHRGHEGHRGVYCNNTELMLFSVLPRVCGELLF